MTLFDQCVRVAAAFFLAMFAWAAFASGLERPSDRVTHFVLGLVLATLAILLAARA